MSRACKTVEQAGAIADGLVTFLFIPEQTAKLMRPLRTGNDEVGRARSDVDVRAAVAVAINDDIIVIETAGYTRRRAAGSGHFAPACWARVSRMWCVWSENDG